MLTQCFWPDSLPPSHAHTRWPVSRVGGGFAPRWARVVGRARLAQRPRPAAGPSLAMRRARGARLIALHVRSCCLIHHSPRSLDNEVRTDRQKLPTGHSTRCCFSMHRQLEIEAVCTRSVPPGRADAYRLHADSARQRLRSVTTSRTGAVRDLRSRRHERLLAASSTAQHIARRCSTTARSPPPHLPRADLSAASPLRRADFSLPSPSLMRLLLLCCPSTALSSRALQLHLLLLSICC